MIMKVDGVDSVVSAVKGGTKNTPRNVKKIAERGGVDSALRNTPHIQPTMPINLAPSAPITEGAPSLISGSTAAAGAVAGVAGAGALAAGAMAPDGEATDRVLEKSEDVLNKAGMAAFLLPMGGNVVGGAMSKVGGWTGAGFLKRGGEATTGFVQKVQSATFGDVSKKVGAGGFFTRVTQPVANVAATVADTVTGWLGIKNWRSGANSDKAAVAHGKAFEVASAMEQNMKHAPTEMRAHLDTMMEAARKGHHTQIDAEALATAGKAIADFKPSAALTKDAKALLGQAEKLTNHLGDAANYAGKAKGWQNVKGAVQGVPKGISGTSAMHGVMQGTWIATSGISMVMDTRHLSRNIDSLKQMYCDLTGEKKVSSMKLFLGSVPGPIADVRGKMIANYGLKQLLDTVNIGIQFSRFGAGFKGIASMMGVMALSGVANSMLSTEVIPAYKAFSDMHKSGKPISAADYAAFVALASKDVQARDEAFAQALGEQYAAEKASPAQILKEINNLRMAERIRGIMTANEAKAKAPTQAPAQPPAVDVTNGYTPSADATANNPSWVARQTAPAQATGNREVMGHHTKTETARATTRSEVTQRV